MSKFYFQLHNDMEVFDEEGVLLPSLEDARREAFRAAAELIGEHVSRGDKINPRHSIEVQDEERKTVFTLRFGDLMEPSASA